METQSLPSDKRKNNLFKTCYYLLQGLNVNFTKFDLPDTLENQSEFPSVLALKYRMFACGIESAATRKGSTVMPSSRHLSSVQYKRKVEEKIQNIVADSGSRQ
ncbi:hypothetical protein GCM10017764_29370 [Sphingobacterium griseoflavum]|uniref:Uncharacterized protein n=1 Tax=Sphingobacterium griseoflavum TaxID=1474952 RepID=A0ABQ3HYG7_9SPHI|nr:hypothetical protein GCM10017764_29370 [Sphingobacterium griseoflavum]